MTKENYKRLSNKQLISLAVKMLKLSLDHEITKLDTYNAELDKSKRLKAIVATDDFDVAEKEIKNLAVEFLFCASVYVQKTGVMDVLPPSDEIRKITPLNSSARSKDETLH